MGWPLALASGPTAQMSGAVEEQACGSTGIDTVLQRWPLKCTA